MTSHVIAPQSISVLMLVSQRLIFLKYYMQLCLYQLHDVSKLLNEVNKNGVHSEFDNGLLMVY